MAPAAITNGHTNGLNGDGPKASEQPVSRRFGKKTPEEKAKIAHAQALSIIKEKLPKMAPLKALLEIDLGSGNGPVYLDARNEEATLGESASGEPDCRLKIKPECIIQFSEGKLEPRYGLFKGNHIAALNRIMLTPIQMHSLMNLRYPKGGSRSP